LSQHAIKDVAEQTGIAAGTIRMWEQRYGFPVPARTPAGYRRYSDDDVQALRRVLALRHRGLSVPAAIERAREVPGPSDHPSLYAAVSGAEGARPQVLRKRTLIALSRAIEHETLAHAAAPLVFGAFQREPFYRRVQARYRRLAAHADASAVFADFPSVGHPAGGPVELPIRRDEPLGNEWAVVVDAPGYAACLLAWEHPGGPPPGGEHDRERRFEALWTLDPRTVRAVSEAAARLAARADPAFGARVAELLADRPLAFEQPVPALTALTTRMVAYLERAQDPAA